MKTKQIIIIRKDLKVRRGKEIAQGAHASMAVLTNNLIGYPFKWFIFPFYILKFMYYTIPILPKDIYMYLKTLCMKKLIINKDSEFLVI